MDINIIFYTNCQSNGIMPNLQLNMKNITIHNIVNYHYIINNIPLPIDIISICDIFIYQPIDKKHNIYSTEEDITNNIINFLPAKCVKIAFPYIYNSGIWGITKDAIKNDDGSIQGNRDVIINLKSNGKTLPEVIQMYLNNEIDFNYKQRFETSLLKLKEKEQKCDIHISEFIINNISKNKLFFTQNHPTPFMFKYVSHQILDIIKTTFYNNVKNSEYVFVEHNSLCNGPIWPTSKSDLSYWKFDYITKSDESADKYYIELINRYYNLTINNDEGQADVYY